MSILIKGMEMPKNCHSCPMCLMRFCQAGNIELSERETRPNAKRQEDCPLVPVPPHGRLIDADANIASLERCLQSPENDLAEFSYSYARAFLSECPTIIPAEEGKT